MASRDLLKTKYMLPAVKSTYPLGMPKLFGRVSCHLEVHLEMTPQHQLNMVSRAIVFLAGSSDIDASQSACSVICKCTLETSLDLRLFWQ